MVAPGYDFARFLSVRRAYGPSFSCDGRRIAFVADLTGVPQAFTVPPTGGWPEQITFTQDRIGLVAFSPTDDRMIVSGDCGGDERTQIHLVTAHGEEMRALTTDLGAMHNFGGWSPDGRFIAYTSNERDPRCFDVYVRDLEADAPRRILETDGQCEVAAWSPSADRLIISRITSSFANDLDEVSLSDGRVTRLTPNRAAARYLRPSYAPDGRSLFLLTDRDADVLVLASLDLDTLALKTLVDLGWDIEDLSLSPDGSQAALTVNVDGYSELYIRHSARGQMRSSNLPRGVVSRGFVGNWLDTLAWSPDGTQLVFSFTGARETQNVWVTDVTTGSARRVTSATQAGLAREMLVEPELVRYPTFDGREIPAFLYARERGGPAVVLVHGGPESQTTPYFDPVVQYLVHRGYAVLAPNVRGSTGYGKAYAHLDDVGKRMDAVADVRAGADWLEEKGWADGRRIAVMGQSYGGFVVLASLCTYPERWAAGVDIYGIASFVTLLENTHPFRRAHREAEYGSLVGDRDLLVAISPLTHVDRIVAPLLCVHGENDMRVPISETEQIVAALERRGVPVRMIRLPDEGHGIVRLANRIRVYSTIADFLGAHV